MKPVYDQDGITVYLADCRDVLPTLAPVDLVLTDPPYGIGEARGKNKSRSNIAVARDYGVSDWDDERPHDDLIEMAVCAGRNAIVFGGNYFRLPPSSCWLVWDKDNGANDFADCELAWTNLPKAVRRIRWRWAGMLQEVSGAAKEERVHPTQKPLAVMKWAITQAPDDVQTILDPFAGSLTTAVAAKALGRKCIAIERHEPYVIAGLERLRQGVLL